VNTIYYFIGFALAFTASWQIALTVLACFPLVIFASIIQMGKLSADHGDVDAPSASGDDNKAGGKKKSKASSASPSQQQQDKSKTDEGSALTGTGHGAVISSAFTHMRTVCAFSMQHKVADHYTKLTNGISALRMKNALIAGLGFGFGQGLLYCIYALLFW
jgi:ABC-type multidrug transport system fused ATPase/permease subunit